MPMGFDTEQDCTAQAPNIAAGNYGFVCRYYSSTDPGKCLTLNEKNALRANQVAIVAIWENGKDLTYFTPAQGQKDAMAARNFALNLAQPNLSAVYFAVDNNFYAADVNGAISQYFHAINSALAANGPAPFRVGVYGSGLTCGSILAAGLARYAMLSGSSKWFGSGFGGWHIQQGATAILFGMNVDMAQAQNDYGAF